MELVWQLCTSRVYTFNPDVFVELLSEKTDTAGLGLVFTCQ